MIDPRLTPKVIDNLVTAAKRQLDGDFICLCAEYSNAVLALVEAYEQASKPTSAVEVETNDVSDFTALKKR